jgi:hypothetical protein
MMMMIRSWTSMNPLMQAKKWPYQWIHL